MAQTKIKLFELNQLTISQWFNARTKRQEREVLEQDIEPFSAPLVATEQLPSGLHKLPEAIQHGHSLFEFAVPQDASGQAAPRSRGRPPSVGTTAASVRPGRHVSPGSAHSASDITSMSVPAAAAVLSTDPEPSAAFALPIPIPVPAVPTPFSATPVPVVPVAASDEKKVPRTTAWRWKKLAEAATAAAAQGLNPRKRQTPQQFLCQKCGQPKTKEFGHSQFRGVHFCGKKPN